MTMFSPLPPEQCEMLDMIRDAFAVMDDATAAALDPVLIEHRDFIYNEFLELPLSL